MLLTIVLPCYNESEVLPGTLATLTGVLDTMAARGVCDPASNILCCDDGSTDGTWEKISAAHAADCRIRGLRLARNSGSQMAMMAGMMEAMATADVVITMDADLQDSPDAIKQMVAEYAAGADIVLGVRSDRDTDSLPKRLSARAFYRMQQRLGLKTVYDHGDFRLMSRHALMLLAQYPERNLYLRGIIPQLGLPTAIVKYSRQSRKAGKTKFSLAKMLTLAIDGITSFTARPMRMIFITGLALLLVDIAVAVWVLMAHFSGRTITGWSSLMLSVWFLGSLILMGIGIVGEYIGKIFTEVKQRPRYAVRDRL